MSTNDHQRRKWLVESNESLLLPELEGRGFHRVPLTREEARSEFRIAYPFGRLRREGPRGFELVEIQLDKRGSPVFRLNLGVVPFGGVEHELVGRIPPEDVWVHYLDHADEMYEVRWRRKWFSARHLPWSEVSTADYQELVRRVVSLVPEIEALFRDGELGKHMREIRLH